MLNATGQPGPQATAGMVMITDDIPALVMYLDPANFALQLPPGPDGPGIMARFCREIAQDAVKLAEHLEQKHGLVGGRHHMHDPSWFSDSGASGGEGQ